MVCEKLMSEFNISLDLDAAVHKAQQTKTCLYLRKLFLVCRFIVAKRLLR